MEHVEQATGKEATKQRVRPKGKVLGELHGRLVSVHSAVGLDALATHWVQNNYWSRAKGDKLAAARKLIATHVADPQCTSFGPVLRDFRELVEHFERVAAMPSVRMPAAIESGRESALRGGPDQIADDRLLSFITEAVNKAIVGMLASRGPEQKALPEPEPAPVVGITSELEDRINKFVQDEVMRRGGGHNVLRNSSEKEHLFSAVWSELDEQMFRECFIDPGARARRLRGKTRIDVCRELGMVGDLYKIACRMFGPRREVLAAKAQS